MEICSFGTSCISSQIDSATTVGCYFKQISANLRGGVLDSDSAASAINGNFWAGATIVGSLEISNSTGRDTVSPGASLVATEFVSGRIVVAGTVSYSGGWISCC